MEGSPNWMPTRQELALWRFFRISGQQVMAGRCATDGELSMATWPPDKLFVDAFVSKHAGHEVTIVTDRMDELSRQQDDGEE